MRLWILSDLHVELTRGWDLPAGEARPQFDVLVVAGDLIPRMERGVKWLLERVPHNPVIYVPGNHEAYGTDIDGTVQKAMAAAEGTKVFVLQDRWIKLGEVTFAGGTAWTDFDMFGDPYRAMRVAADRMNDFRKIRMAHHKQRFRPHHALGRHIQTRTFLDIEMRKPRSGPLVVVTHHAPIPSRAYRVAPHYPGSRLSEEEVLDAAYRSDLTALMRPASDDDGRGPLRPADLWIYGHTHESEDTVIGVTRVVSNAKGYGPWLPQQHAWDNPHFNPNFVIEI
ncbi:metallophosphoesterase [Bradyrhizobium tropiciagri]|uniref:metallophosphoesterase n=1 Tax=Bradyrhizobium tropiciagri TaxID=312253 RepID=UPI00067B81FD|nr:metallophosphoesterase [Bradyrhizobium tropiciagri]